VEIPYSEKSAESETSNFGNLDYVFKCFFSNAASKNVKSRVFGFSKKNLKYVFSNYGSTYQDIVLRRR